MGESTTDAVLPRVAAGLPGAARELHERYGALVWSVVRRAAPGATGEDLVQEIFIDLWRSAAAFDPARGSEAAFVRTIAQRRTIDRNRRQGRGAPEALPEDVPMPELEADPLETREEAERAMEALAALPPDRRRVLELVLVSGLSHRDVAESIDMPLGTVKSHARRGLERLRALLGVEVPDEEAP